MPKRAICNELLISLGWIICALNLLGNETLNMYFICLQRIDLAASLKNTNIVRIKQTKKSNSETKSIQKKLGLCGCIGQGREAWPWRNQCANGTPEAGWAFGNTFCIWARFCKMYNNTLTICGTKAGAQVSVMRWLPDLQQQILFSGVLPTCESFSFLENRQTQLSVVQCLEIAFLPGGLVIHGCSYVGVEEFCRQWSVSRWRGAENRTDRISGPLDGPDFSFLDTNL